jgi:hypothetical protein
MAERQDRYERYDRANRNERSDGKNRSDNKEPASEPERSVPGDDKYRAELEQLQMVDFALVELTLYLDTHPADMQAVQQFNQLAQKRGQLAHAFEMQYGPLLQFGHSYTKYPWQWIETPWPWQV